MVKNNQKGFVSIIVAATIMIILALITVGFTRYVQREQRQALDRQLSRQALYAAESGINETFKVMLEDSTIPNEKTDCNPTGVVADSVLDPINQVEYTCILYDKNPTRLDYSVNSDSSKIVQLSTSTGNSFQSLDISWGNSDTTMNLVSNLPSCNVADEFPATRITTIPVLKFDLTNIASLNRSDLLANTEYLYLSPCQGGAPGVTDYSYNKTSRGNVVRVVCSGSDLTPCRVRISNLISENSPVFMARFKPVYTSANVVLRGIEITPAPITTDEVEFAGQFSIDVTARASDIIRRLRAAIPLTSVGDKPDAVLHSFNDVCKLLEVDIDSGSIINTCP